MSDQETPATSEEITFLARARETLRILFAFKDTILTFLIPIILMPVATAHPSRASSCAYVVLVMAMYWVTDCVHMYVTALIPLIMFPFLGVMGTKVVCKAYCNNTIMFFLGTLVVAIAVEESCLHRRIALNVIRLVGPGVRSMLAGFMGVSMFLSMWLSNTATTALMLPIARSVVQFIDESEAMLMKEKKATLTDAGNEVGDEENALDEGADEVDDGSDDDVLDEETEIRVGETLPETVEAKDEEKPVTEGAAKKKRSKKMLAAWQKVSKPTVPEGSSWNVICFFLAIAYAASIGGTGTIIGTPPNLVYMGQYEDFYPEAGDLNFGSWMLLAIPGMLINAAGSWFLMSIFFFGIPKKLDPAVQEQKTAKITRLLLNQIENLGPMSVSEKMVSFVFSSMIILCFTLSPKFFVGWGDLAVEKPKMDITVDGKKLKLDIIHKNIRELGGGLDPLNTPLPTGNMQITVNVVSSSNFHSVLIQKPSDSVAAPHRKMADGTVGILLLLALFVLPNDLNFLKKQGGKYKASPGVMSWPVVQKKMPWGVLLLLGGGFAMADGIVKSGLSQDIRDALKQIKEISDSTAVIFVSLICVLATQLTLNTTVTVMVLPILKEMSKVVCMHPMTLMSPAVLCSSYAFMLPVGTAPNALVADAGPVPTIVMIKIGFLLMTLCTLVTIFLALTYQQYVFGFDYFPKYADPKNTSGCVH